MFTSIRYDPVLLDAPKHEGLNTTVWNRKVASPWYMLDYHRDRMLRAATYFGWNAAIQKIEGLQGLQTLEDLLDPFAKQAGLNPHRIKILLDGDGKLTYESGPAQPTSLGNLFPVRLPRPLEPRKPQADWAAEEDEARKIAEEQAGVSTPLRLTQTEYQVFIDAESTSHTEYTHYKTTKRQMYDDARNRQGLGLADPKEVLLVNPSDGSIMEGSITTPFFFQHGRWVTPPVSEGFQLGKGSGGNEGTTRRWALER